VAATVSAGDIPAIVTDGHGRVSVLRANTRRSGASDPWRDVAVTVVQIRAI